MAHLHTDMEGLDIHVALEVCEIVIESATLVPIVFALVGLAHLCRSILTRMTPAFSPFGLPVHLIAYPHFDSFAFCSVISLVNRKAHALSPGPHRVSLPALFQPS